MLLLGALVSDNLRNCLKNLLSVTASLGYGIVEICGPSEDVDKVYEK
jgi:hypothetical protein